MPRHALLARHFRLVLTMAGEYDGRVIGALANDLFRVELDGSWEVLAHLSGELRMNIVRILPGDQVRVKVSAIDPTRGRIVRRYGSKQANRACTNR